jgi:hypothetical protein
MRSISTYTAPTKKKAATEPVCECVGAHAAVAIGCVVAVAIAIIVLGGVGILDDDKSAYGYAQFRLVSTNVTGMLPTLAALDFKVLAAYLVEDIVNDVDKGVKSLVWLHPSCTSFASCNADSVSAFNLLATQAALNATMNQLSQQHKVDADRSYHYVRLYTCQLANTSDTGFTFRYQAGYMNTTKAFRDTLCTFVTTKANPPISVKNRQGLVVKMHFNASALVTETTSAPSLANALFNLTKTGPFNVTYYYTFAYPVFTPSFVTCNDTFKPAQALACATASV